MITVKDKLILKHIEKYKFVTIEQSGFLAYPDIKTGYQSARGRLHKLVYKEKRLKIIHDEITKQSLYIDIDADINKIPSSPHRIYLMDLYCKLLGSAVNIEKFEVEKQWLGGKYRSDGLVVFTFGEHRFRYIIEVNMSNNDLNLGRFDEAKDEIIKECNGKVPRMILLDDRPHRGYNTKVYPVIRLDYNLMNFSEIFL